MRQIYKDAFLFHPPEKFSSFRSQSAFCNTMSRATHFIIEKMCDADHPKTGIEEPVEVFHLSAERMCAFNCQKPGNNSLLTFPPLKKIRQVPSRFENDEFATGILGRFVQSPCLVQCAFSQIYPARNRPTLGKGKQRDIIRITAIALDIQIARRFGDNRESLDRYISLDQARQVHRSPAPAL